MFDALRAALARLGPGGQQRILEWVRRSIEDKASLSTRFPSIKNATSLHVILADQAALELIAELFKARGFGISKASLVQVSASLVNPKQLHKDVVRTLGRYLDRASINAIRTSFSLIRMEQEPNQTVESRRNFQAQRERFFQTDSDLRHRVYSDCLSGWVEDVLYEKALDLELEERPFDDIAKTIRDMFADSLYANPMNIYVNDNMPDEELAARLHAKLVQEQRPIVRVFSRKGNWTRVVTVCMNFAAPATFRSHQEERKLGLLSGGIFRIWKAEHGPNFGELERLAIQSFREKAKW